KVPPDRMDRILRGPYDSLTPEEIDELFEDPDDVLFNDDHHTNDTFSTATILRTTSGYRADTHYETIASLGDSSDIDIYRIRAAHPRRAGPHVTSGAGGGGVGARTS